MKPIIALSSRNMKRNPSDNKEIFFVQESYMEAMKENNATYISVVPTSDHDYTHVAQMCDGLLICGGADMDSKFYNETLHEKSEIVSEDIDVMDLKLIEAFIKVNKPILGICRGFQVINVFYGGSLYQDIPSQYDTKTIHAQSEERHIGTHSITLCKDSFLGKANDKYKVNTFHHQAIKQLGKDLEVLAYSEDGIIEAIQNKNVKAVQWHPECMLQDEFHFNVLKTFVNSCKK